LTIIPLYSSISPAKHYLSNTSGTMSIVNACVISLFISPILDLNWWSDLVVKDHQQHVCGLVNLVFNLENEL